MNPNELPPSGYNLPPGCHESDIPGNDVKDQIEICARCKNEFHPDEGMVDENKAYCADCLAEMLGDVSEYCKPERELSKKQYFVVTRTMLSETIELLDNVKHYYTHCTEYPKDIGILTAASILLENLLKEWRIKK